MSKLTRRDFLAAGAAGLAALPALPAIAQDDDRLVVHEWGVVSVPYGGTWGNLRSGGSKADAGRELAGALPTFVHSWSTIVAQEIEAWKTEPVIVDKPVVYFYSKRKREITYKVRVPAGRPKAWYPAAADFGPFPDLPARTGRGLQKFPPDVEEPQDPPPVKPENGFLEFRLELDPSVEKFQDADGWWPKARVAGAAPVRALKARPRRNQFGQTRHEHRLATAVEGFLFYDALAIFDPGAKIEWTREGTVTVRNTSPEPYGRVIAVRVRNGNPSVAVSGALKAGEATRLEPRESIDPGFGAALKEAGLSAAEAAAVVDIWKDEFFAVDGARVLLVLHRDVYDRLLPAEISPAPSEFARVLVAHVECLDPEAEDRVRAWIDQLASECIDEREEATTELRRRVPFAEKLLREAAASHADAEVRARLAELLKTLP